MDQNEQVQFFYQIFDSSLPRLGPGDDASTKKALDTLLSKNLQKKIDERKKLNILDIGCGNGAQTIQIAKHIPGVITALDNHKPYLEELKRRAEVEGVSERIRIRVKDMCELSPDEGPYDLIWSEGALYILGFRKGLEVCHSLLGAGGFMAVTELTWFRPDLPAECSQFFENEYPAMVDVDKNLAAIRGCGFEVIDHFILPESAWRESYYKPLQDRIRVLGKKYAADRDRIEMIESIQKEIDIYKKYSKYYGYVFYLMQRR